MKDGRTSRFHRRHPDGPSALGGEAHRITDAVEPLEADQARRMRRYLIQMGIRVLCFVAAFVAYTYYPRPWLILAFIAAAAVLPYIAVVGVNAGRERPEGRAVMVLDPPAALLESTAPDQDHSTAHPITDPPSSSTDPASPDQAGPR